MQGKNSNLSAIVTDLKSVSTVPYFYNMKYVLTNATNFRCPLRSLFQGPFKSIWISTDKSALLENLKGWGIFEYKNFVWGSNLAQRWHHEKLYILRFSCWISVSLPSNLYNLLKQILPSYASLNAILFDTKHLIWNNPAFFLEKKVFEVSILALNRNFLVKIDALVDHFLRFQTEERTLPVVWHQSLLVFVQR